jgi:hypothetical protein
MARLTSRGPKLLDPVSCHWMLGRRAAVFQPANQICWLTCASYAAFVMRRSNSFRFGTVAA